jgi:hypothetical protein
MAFRTKLDFSSNRQVKQHEKTTTVLSGGTEFGLPYSAMTNGPDLYTSAITQSFMTITGTTSTFSGNNTTTNYNWFDYRMVLGENILSAITSATSATTQNTGSIYTANTTTIIDGNSVNLTYSGVSYDVIPVTVIDLGGGNYSGSVRTYKLDILSASTLDFTGRTIWNDVHGITRTEKLIISNNPQVGYVWTCLDTEGMGEWQYNGSSSGSTIWTAGTGANSAVLGGSGGIASGSTSVSEGRQTIAGGPRSHAEGDNTIASGENSHTEGKETIADGKHAHAEGELTIASNEAAHAEGVQTLASGFGAHSEGYKTLASGESSHAEGESTQALGDNSHAGGNNTIASGQTSFVHGFNSIAGGDGTIVLGSNITGLTDNMIYVPNMIINTGGTTSMLGINTNIPTESLDVDGNGRFRSIGSSASSGALHYTANGTLTTNTSDRRLKTNILSLTNALNKVKQLRGVTYNWSENPTGDTRIGFIAQEVNSIVPELTFVNPNSPENYMGVHYDNVTALLVEAIKELSSGLTISNNTYLETQTILAEDNNIELNYNGTTETAIGGGISVLHALGNDISAELMTDIDGNFITNNDFKAKALTIPTYTPTSSEDINGNIGNVTRDEDYLYIKGSDKWKRVKLEEF